jgi:hypothetical protein
MSHFLVFFDTLTDEIGGDGSDYFIKKNIVEAKNPKDAVKVMMKKIVKANFGAKPDPDDREDLIRQLKDGGATVVELVSPKVTCIDLDKITCI